MTESGRNWLQKQESVLKETDDEEAFDAGQKYAWINHLFIVSVVLTFIAFTIIT